MNSEIIRPLGDQELPKGNEYHRSMGDLGALAAEAEVDSPGNVSLTSAAQVQINSRTRFHLVISADM